MQLTSPAPMSAEEELALCQAELQKAQIELLERREDMYILQGELAENRNEVEVLTDRVSTIDQKDATSAAFAVSHYPPHPTRPSPPGVAFF